MSAPLSSSLPSTSSDWSDAQVRSAVMMVLKEINQLTLSKLCPLPQSMVSNIVNNKHHKKLSNDKCKEFAEWYLKYRAQSTEFPTAEGVPKDTRLTFHPQYEIPLLKNWFQQFPNPTASHYEQFCKQLNQGHIRHERPKVNTSRLKIWWKNEKQKTKRNEIEKAPEVPVSKRTKRTSLTDLNDLFFGGSFCDEVSLSGSDSGTLGFHFLDSSSPLGICASRSGSEPNVLDVERTNSRPDANSSALTSDRTQHAATSVTKVPNLQTSPDIVQGITTKNVSDSKLKDLSRGDIMFSAGTMSSSPDKLSPISRPHRTSKKR